MCLFFFPFNQRFLCNANIDSVYFEHFVNLKGSMLKLFKKFSLKYVSKFDGYLNSINSNGKNVIGPKERFSKKSTL